MNVVSNFDSNHFHRIVEVSVRNYVEDGNFYPVVFHILNISMNIRLSNRDVSLTISGISGIEREEEGIVDRIPDDNFDPISFNNVLNGRVEDANFIINYLSSNIIRDDVIREGIEANEDRFPMSEGMDIFSIVVPNLVNN